MATGHLPGGLAMTIRKALPLSALLLVNACGTNGETSPTVETTSALHEAPAAGARDDRDDDGRRPDVRHVLLISVDGLHGGDLARWTAGHPDSTLARLADTGVDYTDAHTPTPSDSFPGLLALVTGGTPKTTGVY